MMKDPQAFSIKKQRRPSLLARLRRRKTVDIDIPAMPSLENRFNTSTSGSTYARKPVSTTQSNGDSKIWDQMRSKGLVLKGQPGQDSPTTSSCGTLTPKAAISDSMPSLLVETEFTGDSLYDATSDDSLLPYSSSRTNPSSQSAMYGLRLPSTFSVSTSSSRPVSIASTSSFPASAQSNPSLDSLYGYGTSTACTTPAQTPSDICFNGHYFSAKEETPVDVLWADLETQLGQGLTPRLPPTRPAKSPARYSDDAVPLLSRTKRLDSEVELAQLSLRADQSMEEGELDLMIGRALLSESIMGEEEVSEVLAKEQTKRKDRLAGHGRPESMPTPVRKISDRKWSDSYVPALDMVLDWPDTRLPTKKARPVSVPALKLKTGLPRSTSGSNPSSPSTPKASLSTPTSRIPSTPRSRIPSSPSTIPSNAAASPAKPPGSPFSSSRIPSAPSSPSKLPAKAPLVPSVSPRSQAPSSPYISTPKALPAQFETPSTVSVPSSPSAKPILSRWSLASAAPASPVESKLPRFSASSALAVNSPIVTTASGISSWFGFRRAAE